MKPASTHLVLVEHDSAIRETHRAWLKELAGPEGSLHVFPDTASAKTHLESNPCDVLLLELDTPEGATSATPETLARQLPRTAFLGLSADETESTMLEALSQGVHEIVFIHDLDAGRMGRAVRRARARKRTELARESATSCYHDIVAHSPDLIFINRNNAVSYVNPAGVRLLRASSEREILGRSPLDFFHPADHAAVRERTEVLRQRPCSVPTRLERIVDLAGGVLEVEVIAISFNTEDGPAIQVICRDLTERRKAEGEATRNAEMLRAMAEGTTDAVFVKDRDGRYLLCNSAAADIIGRNAEEIRGRDDSEFFPPESAQTIMDHDREVMESGRTSTREESLTVNETLRTFLATKFPHRDASGAVVGVVGISRDITERKLNETLLAWETEVLEAISSGLPLPSLLKNITVGLERMYPGALASILTVDSDGIHLRHGAAPSLPGSFVNAVDGRPAGPKAGSCGTSVHRGEPVITGDIATDPLWEDYRELALGHGLRACWSVPVIDAAGKVMASFALYHRAPREPGPGQIDVLTRAARIVAIAIERDRREQALRTSEANMADAQRIAHFGSWELDLNDRREIDRNSLHWSDEMFRIAGFAPGEVQVTNELFFSLVPQDEHDAIREAVAGAIRDRHQYSIVHRFIRPNGEERTVQETAQIFFDEQSGEPVRLVGTAHDITERRKAAAALEQEATRRGILFEQAKDGIFVINEAADVIETNRSFAEMLGCTVEEVLKLHPWDWDVIYSTPEKVAEKWPEMPEAPMTFETRIRRKDGIVFDAEISSNPARLSGERVLFLVCRDVTERKRAEVTLRASLKENAELRAALDEHAIVARTDAHGKITFVNDKFCALSQYSRAELLGRDHRIINSGHHTKEFFKDLWDTIASGKVWHGEIRNRAKDGSHYWVDTTIVPFLGEDGKPRQYVAIRADITERKLAEQQLREQAALLDKAQDAILVRDLDHRILYWNKSAERLYGWTAGEALGRSIKELLYDRPDNFLAATETVNARGEWTGEIEQLTKSGKPIPVEGHWTLVRDEHGNPTSILAINTDISQRKALEAQFLRAQRMESIGTLAGGIAHDLNNVLAPILMSIELLKLDEQDEERVDILKTVESSAKRGAEMVSQVLSFARGMDGRRIKIQARHLLGEIAKITRETFPKNINILATLPEDLWPLEGDPTQLHQVLLNLCVNARDAMPDGGRIQLAAENMVIDEHYASMNIEARVGPHVRIEVEDSGHGISSDILDKIFDPFFTTKEVGKGTGLGLSTSLAIIKSHGGFIRAYSDPGMGTKFRVYLPANAERGTADADDMEVKLPRGDGELVLVVDDEASIRQITRQTLEAFGYRVMLAADGSEAVSIYAGHKDKIAVVLTDMMMPVMDGPATIQVLLRLNPKVRIIAASGITANGKVAKAVDAGITHFLPKPYTAETLLKIIARILGKST